MIGKTGSGKDLTLHKLVGNYGFHKIVTYTSRPMRVGEHQGGAYHFLSTSEFQMKIKQGFFAEYKVYDTAKGEWYYGCAKEDILNADVKDVIILTPDGLKDVQDMAGDELFVVYIYSNLPAIKRRVKKRGDDPKEAERRIRNDLIDFKGAELLADCIVYNNEGSDINDIAAKVAEHYKEYMERRHAED